MSFIKFFKILVWIPSFEKSPHKQSRRKYISKFYCTNQLTLSISILFQRKMDFFQNPR